MVKELSEDKRARFLQAALDLFVAQGVQHTSTAEIARAAGTAAGTLFLYFPTKQQLINDLLLDISRAQADGIEAGLLPALAARPTFFIIWSHSLQWFLDHPAAYAFTQQVRDSNWVTPATVQETARLFAFYDAAIQKGLAEGSIHPYPSDLIGGFLYQGIVAVMNYATRLPDPSARAAAIQLGFDIFWNGIKNPEPPDSLSPIHQAGQEVTGGC